jgi:hypothetical protein
LECGVRRGRWLTWIIIYCFFIGHCKLLWA